MVTVQTHRHCRPRKRFILQFTVSQKVYKRCFFNTKYLPKHQGVSCCDLLHLQYLSDVSLYPSLHPTNFSSWFHYPGTEKKRREREANTIKEKESKVPALSPELMQLHHLNNAQDSERRCNTVLTWPFNIFSMRKECKLFPTSNEWNGVLFADEDNVSEVKTSTHK